jgi:hypothetical protein
MQIRTVSMGACAAFALVVVLVLAPGTANAQYGTWMGSADLDGNGSVESVYNNLSSINVVSGSTVTSYSLGFTSWALLYGNFSSVVDLDGQPGAEIPINTGGQLVVITHRTRDKSTYQIGSGSWAAAPGGIVDLDGQAGAEITIVVPGGLKLINHSTRASRDVNVTGQFGQFAVVSNAVKDLDGVAGAEIVMVSGGALLIYRYPSGGLQSTFISSGSWSVVTTGSNAVVDMDGQPGAELLLALTSQMQTFHARTSSLRNYPISTQYAVLSDGVRDLDGQPGAEVAVVTNNSTLLMLRPRDASMVTLGGSSQLGTYWNLTSFGNYDGFAGDEIRIYSQSFGRNFEVCPRTLSIRSI